MTCNALTILTSVRIGVPGKYKTKKRGFRGHGMHIGLMMPHVYAVLNRSRITGYDQRDGSAPVLHGDLLAIWRFIQNSSLPSAREGRETAPVKETFKCFSAVLLRVYVLSVLVFFHGLQGREEHARRPHVTGGQWQNMQQKMYDRVQIA